MPDYAPLPMSAPGTQYNDNYDSYEQYYEHNIGLKGDPDFSLLLESYILVRSTADSVIKLDKWKCGTQCCAGGLLAMQDKFINLGLHLELINVLWAEDSKQWRLVLTDPDGTKYFTFLALAKVFNISTNDAEYLFGPRREAGSNLDQPYISDRQAFLYRMEDYFDRHGLLATRKSSIATTPGE